MRFRKLTIEPGGIVPWHSHDDRPALIYVQQGDIVEYASNCVDPIVHKAGDCNRRSMAPPHWWKNLGKETVILYVGDVRKDPNDHNMFRRSVQNCSYCRPEKRRAPVRVGENAVSKTFGTFYKGGR